MRTFAKSQIRYSKSQRMGIFAFMAVMVLVEVGAYFLNRSAEVDHQIEIPPELVALQQNIDQQLNSPTNSSKQLENFNPNELSAEEWQNLGFSEKQAATILKYKYSLGGNFSSKAEIRNCFVISDLKFQELEPFMELKNVSVKHSNYNSYSKSEYDYPKKEKVKIQYQKFNPNDYSLEDWMRIGFSEKQANSILKYKRSLGGEFKNLDQIQASYVISEDKFREMKPFIVFPKSEAKKEQNPTIEEISHPKLEKFNPNELSREQWMDLGFTEKQVNTIFNYKRSLGGKFKNAEILKKCYSISEEKFLELEPFLVFE